MKYLKNPFKYIQDYRRIHIRNSKITEICKKYGIRHYIINDDGSIDSTASVYLNISRLTEMPLTFRNIQGGFYCGSNYLTSLKGSPRYVSGIFSCDHNRLTSLEGGPDRVDGYFSCDYNPLTSLEGGPKYVGGSYNARCVDLTSLKGCAEYVGDDLFVTTANIKSIEGFPKELRGQFYFNGPIQRIWNLFLRELSQHQLELFNDYDIIQEDEAWPGNYNVILERLEEYLFLIKKRSDYNQLVRLFRDSRYNLIDAF